MSLRQRSRLSRPSYRIGLRRGRVNGHCKGREDGFRKGLADTLWPIALLITPSKGLPSFDIILQQPFQYLKSLGLYNYRYRTEQEVSEQDIDAANIVVFLRHVEPDAYRLLEAAKAKGKRTVYCIDDNFLAVPPVHGLADYYLEPRRQETFKSFLRNAQIVKVDSRWFAEYIRFHFNPHVADFPSSVDFAWLEKTPKPTRNDGQIVIGYEGTTKEEDFAPVVPAIRTILHEYAGSVRVEFLGYVPDSLVGVPGVSHESYDYDYRAFILNLFQRTWDIGLAPLEDNLFNRCKTNNKFREYSACWIPGIYSSMPTYADWVAQRESGLIVAQTSEGWYQGMKEMIERPELRLHIREQAGLLCRKQFAVDACASNWRQHILNI